MSASRQDNAREPLGSSLLGLSQRQPPHNLQAEQALLGAILANAKAYFLVADFLRGHHFADPVHAAIYEAAGARISKGGVADAVTMRRHFEGAALLDEYGGAGYLAQLLSSMVGIINAAEYGRAIVDDWTRRELIDVGETLVNRAFDRTAPVEDMLTEAVKGIDTAAAATTERAPTISMDRALDAALEAVERAAQAGGPVGTLTGFPSLDRVYNGLKPQTLHILAGRPGMGKEMPIDTPVLTPSGWRPIGEIRVGDFVVGPAGRPIRVVAVHPQGVTQAYRVRFRDGTSTECGINHVWSVAPSSGRAMQRATYQNLTLRQLLDAGIARPKANGRHGARWRIPLTAAVHLPAASLPIDPYVLGALIGDGCTVNRSCRLSNPDFDSDIRERVKARLPQGLSFRENRSGACPYFDITGKGLKDFKNALDALGLNCKGPVKFVPKPYMRGSIEQRLELLRGLMDTDGSCQNNHTMFYSASEQLANDVAELVRSLGGLAIRQSYDRSHQGKSNEHRVNIKINVCPFHTSRKAAGWRHQPISRYIWEVTPSRMVEQVCITVDTQDGLYLANDYIVTHNSALGWQVAINVGLACRNGKMPGGVFFQSLEMAADELGERALSAFGNVPAELLQRGEHQLHRSGLIYARDYLAGLPLEIDETPSLNIQQIAVRAREVHRKFKGLSLIVVDHLHIVAHDPDAGRRQMGMVQALGDISKGLKKLAKDLRCPVLALAQLSRGVESREDKRPVLTDLRASGDIEQDADSVAFVYRPEYYLGKGDPEQRAGERLDAWQARVREYDEMKARVSGKAEIIFEKMRRGQGKIVKLRWDGETTSFREPDGIWID